MELRAYRPEDCEALLRLFYDTVHTVNARDYTKEQLDAWATGQEDRESWDRSFREHFTVVAVSGGELVGFGDMDDTGYLDRLYVHKDHQGEGIGSAICGVLEEKANGAVVTHASITARPFFEGRGYSLIREQRVERRGIFLTNYVMERKGD